jgi:hypothetical protein
MGSQIAVSLLAPSTSRALLARNTFTFVFLVSFPLEAEYSPLPIAAGSIRYIGKTLTPLRVSNPRPSGL